MRKGRAASEFLHEDSRTANPLPVGIHSTVRIANYYNRQNRHGLVACHLLVSDASVTRTCVQLIDEPTLCEICILAARLTPMMATVRLIFVVPPALQPWWPGASPTPV